MGKVIPCYTTPRWIHIQDTHVVVVVVVGPSVSRRLCFWSTGHGHLDNIDYYENFFSSPSGWPHLALVWLGLICFDAINERVRGFVIESGAVLNYKEAIYTYTYQSTMPCESVIEIVQFRLVVTGNGSLLNGKTPWARWWLNSVSIEIIRMIAGRFLKFPCHQNKEHTHLKTTINS